MGEFWTSSPGWTGETPVLSVPSMRDAVVPRPLSINKLRNLTQKSLSSENYKQDAKILD